jgi:hypothetical protein
VGVRMSLKGKVETLTLEIAIQDGRGTDIIEINFSVSHDVN